jgi:hypothetical protein
MTDIDHVDLISEFFGGSGCAGAFLRANYRGLEYGRSVLTEEIAKNKTMREHTTIWQLMTGGVVQSDGTVKITSSFIDFIVQTALFHRTIDNVLQSETEKKLIGNDDKIADAAISIIDRVYNNWNNLPNDVRTFYRQHLLLFEKTDAGSWLALESPHNTRASLENLRLNLLKDIQHGTIDTEHVLFGASLPKNEVDMKATYEYTHKSTQRSIEITFQSVNGLQDLYEKVLKEGENALNAVSEQIIITTLGDISTLPLTLKTRPEREKCKFKIDNRLFVKNLISTKNEKTIVPTKLDEVLSMVDGKLYKRDQSGTLSRKDNMGDYVKVVDNVFTSDNCDMMGLNVMDSHKCTEIVSCLLDSTRDLDSCLNVLKNRNMFEVGREDMQKVHPSIALGLFEKFGIRLVEIETKHGRVKVPQTFESWINSVTIHESVKSAILENLQLVNYLKGVISIFRQNPIALTDNKALYNLEKLPTYFQNTRMGFTKHLIDPSKALDVDAEYMRSVKLTQPPRFNMENLPFPLPNNMYSVLLALQAFGGNNEVQLGGGVLADTRNVSDNLKSEFNMLSKRLEESNRPLDQESTKGIQKALDELKKLEKQLKTMMSYLDLFTEANDVIRLNGGNDTVVPSNLLEAAYAAQNIQDYLKNAISEIKGCVDKNLNRQHKIVIQLGGEIYPALIDVLNGKKNSIIGK